MKLDPDTSANINLGVLVGGAVLAFLANTDIPSPVTHEQNVMIHAWATYIGSGGAALVAAFNVWLHKISSDQPGSMAK